MIPLIVVLEDDTPPQEVKIFVRRIAREDGTSFAVSMRAYLALVDTVNRFVEEAPGSDPQALAERILHSRATLRSSLGRAIKAIDTEALPGIHQDAYQVSDRRCTHPRCVKKVHPTSWKFCFRHMPLHPGTDDGNLVYCLPPPRALAKAIATGKKRRDRLDSAAKSGTLEG